MNLLPLLLCSVVLAQPLCAAVLVLPASRDNTLYQTASGDRSNGRGEYLFAGMTGRIANRVLRRGLLAFDLASAIPAGSVIDSVVLRLNLSQANFSVPSAAFSLHRVTNSWGEGISNAGDPGGAGAASEAGDATWLHRFFDAESWNAPGGDFAQAASLISSVGGVGVYEFTSPQMAADVQGWLDNASGNFGWMIRGDETLANSARRFDSREHIDPASRPELTVTFHAVPEPATSMLCLAGLAVGFARRKRGSVRA